MVKVNDDAPATKKDLNDFGAKLRSEMHDIGLKLQIKIDRIEDRVNTQMVTKNDFNRLYNLMDSVAGSVKDYQRRDTLRGDAVMRHEEAPAGHEKRLASLETRK